MKRQILEQTVIKEMNTPPKKGAKTTKNTKKPAKKGK